MGKENLAIIAKDREIEFNLKDTTKVIQIFRRGTKECGEKFKKAILDDMAAVDYPLKDIGVAPVTRHRYPAGYIPCTVAIIVTVTAVERD